MALVVEDGTGRADAQSFVDVTYVDAWVSARGLLFSGSSTVKEQNLVKAFDFLCNGLRFKRWRGTIYSPLQVGPFPRIGVVFPDGGVLPDMAIPWQLKYAQCALGVLSMAGVSLQANLKNGGALITSKSIGPISTSYAQPQTSSSYGQFSLAAETLYTEVIGYLAPLLLLESDRATVSYEVPEVPDDYISATFENPQ